MWPDSSSVNVVNLVKKSATVPEIKNFPRGLLFWRTLYIAPMKNTERLQIQKTSIVDFKLDLLNKHARDVLHYIGLYTFKVTPPFTNTSVKNACDSCCSLWQLHFLQGVSIAWYVEPCVSYDRDVCPSVRYTLALSENDAS